jgi:hypothetical protein
VSTITSLGKDVNSGFSLEEKTGRSIAKIFLDTEEQFKMKSLDSFEQILQINDIVASINSGWH